MNHEHCEFTEKVQSYFSHMGILCIFNLGSMQLLEINGKYAWLWQDAKGNISCCFDMTDKEHSPPSIIRLSNVLSNYFGHSIEVLNNQKEYLKKMTNVTAGLNKALSDSQRYNDYNEYSQRYNSTNQMKDNHEVVSSQPIVIDYQQQLHNNIISLSAHQLEAYKQSVYLHTDHFPVLQKKKFEPNQKMAFYRDEQGALVQSEYIPSKYMVKNLFTNDVKSSLIMSFIFFMAKKDIKEAIKIFVFLANSVHLNKLPYALVLHSAGEDYMKLFYEELVEPVLNIDHCEKITNNELAEKSLAVKLHHKVMCNFHNVTVPTILGESAKELTNRLIHKDSYKLNRKLTTTVANTLITSTTTYIPLIAKDVTSLVVKIESSLHEFCKDKNIPSNKYAVAKLLENDLENFAGILRSLDMDRLNTLCLTFYKGENDILDGDVDKLDVFIASVKNKDKTIYKLAIKNNSTEELYNELSADFDKNRVNSQKLIDFFSMLFGKGIYTNNRAVITAVKKKSSSKKRAFDHTRQFNIQGIVYYEI